MMTIPVDASWFAVSFSIIVASLLAIVMFLWSIARSLEKTADALAEMNEITNPEGLGEAFDGDGDDVGGEGEENRNGEKR